MRPYGGGVSMGAFLRFAESELRIDLSMGRKIIEIPKEIIEKPKNIMPFLRYVKTKVEKTEGHVTLGVFIGIIWIQV